MATSDLTALDLTGRPFPEAVEYLRQKVNLPTEAWHDLWQGMHARAFVIAGAVKSEMLGDFRTAIDRAISQGRTIEQFRRDFDGIVKRYGWSHNGSRNWRSKVIYNTNIQTAYQAGRHKQLVEMKTVAPFWEYRTKGDRRVREIHRSWDGLILSADDPWWETHYPPNGWLCRCRVWPRTKQDLEKRGLTGPQQAPKDGFKDWPHPTTGEVIKVPTGIDPGWAYNVGTASRGRRLSEEAMNAWRASKNKWERLTPGDWQTHGRPETIPVDRPQARPGRKTSSHEETRAAIEAVIGGAEKTYRFQADELSYPVLVNAETLAGHINKSRAAFIPFLEETLTDPFEVWMGFERHTGSGKVVLRQRIIKAVELEKGRGMLIVTNSVNGVMEAWTVIPTRNIKYLMGQRTGKLIWGRKEEN